MGNSYPTSELEFLTRARDRISGGWCQGDWECIGENDTHCFCAAGALGYDQETVYGDNPDRDAALCALYRHGIGCLEPADFDLVAKITVWNDRCDNAHQVIAAFDKAIAAVRAGE